ncbi:hypothetical protein HPULCUR_011963 [Helicostylum pulchrum]|uniref:Uncharacterized protein n=1 Tax=Helicostylum pulchrum TaxID=562976 RepID=A0ABP9YHJ8_9FUNG
MKASETAAETFWYNKSVTYRSIMIRLYAKSYLESGKIDESMQGKHSKVPKKHSYFTERTSNCKVIYFDGHEIEDVVAYRKECSQRIMEYQRYSETYGYEDVSDGTVVDAEEVNWIELLDEGLKKAKEATVLSIKGKRTFALLES